MSKGQRRRADIICMMALGDLASTRVNQAIDLLILDEVFDGLDPAGMDCAIAMLHGMTDTKSSIFVTTHQATLADRFQAVETVVFQHGVATLGSNAA